MFSAKIPICALFYAAVLIVATTAQPVQAQPAESDYCVEGVAFNQLNESTIRSYYRHNAVVMSSYRDIFNSFQKAAMRDAQNAEMTVRHLEEAKATSPQLARTMWGVITEPPTFVNLSRSCERLSKTNIPLTAEEYPILFQSHTPRVIGEMCVEEPVIQFDVKRHELSGVQIHLGDFYNPAYSSDNLFRYADLEREADRKRRLPAFIRALMGIRMAQCGDLPDSMMFVAFTEDQLAMRASVLFFDQGIQIQTRDDAIAQRIVAAHTRSKEQLAARLDRHSNWEKHAAVGAAAIISGLAIMAMSRCNDRGDFGNTALPDCE